jgi:hypothetical protein
MRDTTWLIYMCKIYCDAKNIVCSRVSKIMIIFHEIWIQILLLNLILQNLEWYRINFSKHLPELGYIW